VIRVSRLVRIQVVAVFAVYNRLAARKLVQMHPSYVDSASRAADPMADSISYPPSAHYIPPYYPPPSATGNNVHLVAPPRAEPTQRRRPKYTRSKTGCMTCRVKKIKCDETKPNCIRCVHGQRECTWPEGVPQRKKSAPKKIETVDGRPSTAGSSGLSEASTPPTRDNTPPKRERLELGLPPLVSRRQSEPFMHVPPVSSDAGHRSSTSMMSSGSQQHYQHVSSHSSSNMLSVIPEVPSTYPTLPPVDHRYANTHHQYMPPIVSPQGMSRTAHGSSYRSMDNAQSLGHWQQSSLTSHLDSMDPYFSNVQERNLVGHSSLDNHTARYP